MRRRGFHAAAAEVETGLDGLGGLGKNSAPSWHQRVPDCLHFLLYASARLLHALVGFLSIFLERQRRRCPWGDTWPPRRVGTSRRPGHARQPRTRGRPSTHTAHHPPLVQRRPRFVAYDTLGLIGRRATHGDQRLTCAMVMAPQHTRARESLRDQQAQLPAGRSADQMLRLDDAQAVSATHSSPHPPLTCTTFCPGTAKEAPAPLSRRWLFWIEKERPRSDEETLTTSSHHAIPVSPLGSRVFCVHTRVREARRVCCGPVVCLTHTDPLIPAQDGAA